MKIGADIGGTKTLLEARAGAFTLLRLRYENDAFPDFDTLLAHFLSELRTHHRAPVTATCLALAGPITGERARLTTRPRSRVTRASGLGGATDAVERRSRSAGSSGKATPR